MSVRCLEPQLLSLMALTLTIDQDDDDDNHIDDVDNDEDEDDDDDNDEVEDEDEEEKQPVDGPLAPTNQPRAPQAAATRTTAAENDELARQLLLSPIFQRLLRTEGAQLAEYPVTGGDVGDAGEANGEGEGEREGVEVKKEEDADG